ncbi:acyltransferase [Phormidium tenue]|uniref:Acetyltransferase n=1 Tax=Phormidium tenue NIES-30 TaxID=549789 RepID=A0A1U7J5X2_9CYAN|nr:acyltransferase [Phormidium tenue]MBD2232357.1 acyltransferase [Phormidium tenue FACHB-1052]OKH48148.1 hypothetical protein NIES30_11690 [Phormidium tenue NIES-30]
MIFDILGKTFLLSNSVFNRIRSTTLLTKFKSVGEGSRVEWPSKISGGQYITLGKNVYIAWNGWLFGNDHYGDQHFTPEILIDDGAYIGNACHIVACNRVTVGKGVLIADRCYLSDNLHDYRDVDCSIRENQLLVPGEVKIGDNSWIGENVCIYGAVTVGKHCVVGANSVLTKSIPDYSVAVGVPARVVKRYDFVGQRWCKTDGDGTFIQEPLTEEKL